MSSRPNTHIYMQAWCIVFIALWLVPALAREDRPKKLIYYGWGTRDTQYIRDNWQEMEKMPFDGIGIFVALDRQAWREGKQSSYNHFGPYVMGPKAFRLEDFQEAIADLKAVNWQFFTDNFFAIMLSSAISEPGFNWFDDDRWRIISNNFAVMATIAAKAGARGLILDPEHYGYEMFSFGIQRKIVDRPFKDYTQKARQRGRQIIAAIAKQIPKPVIFSLFGNSMLLFQIEKGSTSESVTHALMPAFLDGILDSMPTGGYFVDGYEAAYGFKERKQFVEARRRILKDSISLSAFPARYRDKVKVGFGLWLDNRRQLDYFRPEEFRQSLGNALDLSDGYVWIYSERPRFFPPADLGPDYLKAISGALRTRRY